MGGRLASESVAGMGRNTHHPAYPAFLAEGAAPLHTQLLSKNNFRPFESTLDSGNVACPLFLPLARTLCRAGESRSASSDGVTNTHTSEGEGQVGERRKGVRSLFS